MEHSFIETVVKPNQKEYNYYHEQFRRVPTVDQCYDDDRLCKWEANQQLIRDKYVQKKKSSFHIFIK